jgi:glycosyltransferase involved in cell wall biosynthesis
MAVPARPWISIVIPIKDERENLPPLTEQLLKVLDTHERSRTTPFEILYIDDGSTDGSGALMDNLAAQYQQIRVLHFDRNYGQTSAFDAGFRQAQGDLIVTLDGDLQFDPADILTLLPLASQYDLVCGWRKDRHDNLVRTGCSLKVFRREVVEKLQLFEGLHRFFPALAKMHGFTLTEVPVRHLPRAHGYSKYGIGNRLFKSLYDLIAARWMQRRVLHYKLRDERERRDA